LCKGFVFLSAGNTEKMDHFTLLVFGLSSALEGCIIDIVGKLPEEMSVSILR
jgi:hypothetical protein